MSKKKILNKTSVLLILLILIMSQGIISAQEDGDAIVLGKYKKIHSTVLNEDRLLLIHLPREYEETQLNYPVLYLLYGQDINNYFADAVIISEKLGSTGEIPPLIIVGVANTNRYRDNLPIATGGRKEGGGAATFIRFFEEELFPYININYRTKDFRILAGPQAGAVFGLYALITRPGLFNAGLTENPFMDLENAEFLFPKVESFFKHTPSYKGFLYVKCEKDENPKNLEFAVRFSELLGTDRPEGFRFKVDIRESSGYFIQPLPFQEGLRTLFSGHKLPEDFKTNSLTDILDHYEKLTEEVGFEIDPPSLMLTFEGDKLSQQSKIKEAIEVFEYMLTLYPKSLNSLWRLGETYRGMGDFERARDYYQAFLDIRDSDAAFVHSRLNEVKRIINESAVYRVEQEINKNGIKAGLKKFREIKADPQNQLYFDESEFNAVGYRLMVRGNLKDALEVFMLNVKLFPNSANAYDSLGEAYMNSGDKKNAVKNYKKSLELNPENNNASEMLKKLEKK
ncbi:MAG: tetratricopeptide repeat protein [Candidatus Aminicenantes bacterium]|nr:tetratricopeptide repeat protein [Candidatus Aminicenantes bacterium]